MKYVFGWLSHPRSDFYDFLVNHNKSLLSKMIYLRSDMLKNIKANSC
jgi:hypothetical protein